MAGTKPYARLDLTEWELKNLLNAVSTSRADVFAKWGAAEAGPEKNFYAGRVDQYDALLTKLNAPIILDGSQDAEPEEEDEDEEQEDE